MTDSRDITPGSLLPWSVQERITDIALYRDRLYFSVNGFGILTCPALKAGQVDFKTYYDHSYFEYKTLTTILPVYSPGNNKIGGNNETGGNEVVDEYILCHLYFNAMVFPFQPDDFLFDSANIIKLTHSKEELFIEELYPAPPEQVPHWEIVGFLPVNRSTFHLEWKNSQNTFTEFRYSCYSVKEQKEEEEEREDFINAYNFTPLTGEKVPGSLKFLCEKIMVDGPWETQYTTFHFLVKEKRTHITNRYIEKAMVPLTDGNFEIVTVRMFSDELGYYALTQTGLVYFTRHADPVIRQIQLPHLPEGFHYVEFFIHDNILLLTWEESVFMNVGAAGLLIVRDDLLS